MRSSFGQGKSQRTWRLLRRGTLLVCCWLLTVVCVMLCTDGIRPLGNCAWHSNPQMTSRFTQASSSAAIPHESNSKFDNRTYRAALRQVTRKTAYACCRLLRQHDKPSVAEAVPLQEARTHTKLGRKLQQELSWNTHEATTTAARVIDPPAPGTRNVVHAFTPEAAEAVAYSEPSGIHRITSPQDRQTYATVELDPYNDSRGGGQGSAVKPYARSAQDVAASRFRRRRSSGDDGFSRNPFPHSTRQKRGSNSGGDPKYSSSGTVMQPILVVGEMAYAQTYSGATAVAASDSWALNKGGKLGTPEGTTTAASNAVTWVPGLIAANTAQQSSVGVSNSERVGSLAASGAADGKIALAQAESAIAMAQAEGISWDESDKEDWHDTKYLSRNWNESDQDIWDWLDAAVAGQHNATMPGVRSPQQG